MATKSTGLSRDFIIHPGETIKEIIEDRGLTQKEVATKAGITVQQVNRVVNGISNVSPSFAKQLEYIFDVPASFWISLQANYDAEMLAFNETNSVSPEELQIAKKLKKIVEEFVNRKIIPSGLKQEALVLKLRRVLKIADLTFIPKQINIAKCYRASQVASIDVYVLYAWHILCDYIAKETEVDNSLNLKSLKEQIPAIKKCMGEEPYDFYPKLKKIFAECGINFNVVKNFTGAPVQGFIKTAENGSVILCLTLRFKWADIFWFTLFHEIGHIVNGHVQEEYIDYFSIKNDLEEEADKFASSILIPTESLQKLQNISSYQVVPYIHEIAKECSIPVGSVVGRLQHEGIIKHNEQNGLRAKYCWAD